MKQTVILIFDIGKLHKKYIVFDRKFTPLEHEMVQFAEVPDEDGDLTDDLREITKWIYGTVSMISEHHRYKLLGVNFTSYGGSLVHLDKDGQLAAPFYNFNKPFPHNLYYDFEIKHNENRQQAIETGTPGVGMINSGFQLFWLKYHKPEFYRKIRYALHLPHYFSFLLTGIPLSDYCSLGCHTAMWDYQNKRLHRWVTDEKIEKKLATPVPSNLVIRTSIQKGKKNYLDIGVGCHDHMAALVPYLKLKTKPFILVRTGIWSISLNAFGNRELTIHDLAQGCHYYRQPNGEPVLAHQLFSGGELSKHISHLGKTFGVAEKKINHIRYDKKLDQAARKNGRRHFYFPNVDYQHQREEQIIFDHVTQAYHQLISELVDIQISSISKVSKDQVLDNIIIEGSLIENQVFLKMLVKRLRGVTIRISTLHNSQALGAALLLKPAWWTRKFLKSQVITLS